MNEYYKISEDLTLEYKEHTMYGTEALRDMPCKLISAIAACLSSKVKTR